MNKLSKFCYELSNYTKIKPEIYLSPATGYRARAEFGYSNHSYTMVEDEQNKYMDKSSIPHLCIQHLMSNLLSKINDSVDIPIIVGGGVKNDKDIELLASNGASFVVTGSMIESISK